jgi:hypothetical protein
MLQHFLEILQHFIVNIYSYFSINSFLPTILVTSSPATAATRAQGGWGGGGLDGQPPTPQEGTAVEGAGMPAMAGGDDGGSREKEGRHTQEVEEGWC